MNSRLKNLRRVRDVAITSFQLDFLHFHSSNGEYSQGGNPKP
jgi:hypothetical protein